MRKSPQYLQTQETTTDDYSVKVASVCVNIPSNTSLYFKLKSEAQMRGVTIGELILRTLDNLL